MKIFDGKNGRIVVEYDSLQEAGLHPNVKLERINELSDGYHTYDELYEFRKMYNATLFNEWAIPITCHTPTEDVILERPKYNVHKSWKHHDTDLKAAIAYNKGVEKLNDPFIPLNKYKSRKFKKEWKIY